MTARQKTRLNRKHFLTALAVAATLCAVGPAAAQAYTALLVRPEDIEVSALQTGWGQAEVTRRRRVMQKP